MLDTRVREIGGIAAKHVYCTSKRLFFVSKKESKESFMHSLHILALCNFLRLAVPFSVLMFQVSGCRTSFDQISNTAVTGAGGVMNLPKWNAKRAASDGSM